MPCNKESNEKFKIITTTIYKRRKTKSTHESNNYHISDVRTDEIIQHIEFRELLLFEIIPYKCHKKENEEYFFEIIHSRNSEFASKKYAKKDAPRKDRKEDTKNTVEHF